MSVLQAVLPYFIIQRFQAHAQFLGYLGFVAIEVVEEFFDHDAFHVFEGHVFVA